MVMNIERLSLESLLMEENSRRMFTMLIVIFAVTIQVSASGVNKH